LGGLAVLVVVALAVAITVLVVRPKSGGSTSPTTQNGDSEFASASDKGPANIIVDDPTCAAWGKIAREYYDEAKTVNWSDRDFSVPASTWTAEQRAMYETVGKAMTHAADQARNLVTQTPHRVMRELYEQFIAYAHTFVDRIPSYIAEDDHLAVTTDALTTGTADVCSAIDYRSAPPIAPLIAKPEPPSAISPLGDPAVPTRFLATTNAICPAWASSVTKFSADTAAWRALDPATPATDWTPDQRSINDEVASVMSNHADELERLGRQAIILHLRISPY
jgi:hypothetical protein